MTEITSNTSSGTISLDIFQASIVVRWSLHKEVITSEKKMKLNENR